MSISSVTSEALQLKLRQLLPSQQGFGTDLSASDTIIPVIDLTSAAEGSDVPEFLQTALGFASQNVYAASGSTDVVANTAGFWRIFGISNIRAFGFATDNKIILSDGLANKTIYEHSCGATTNEIPDSVVYDFVVFLDSGDSISVSSSHATNSINGSARQIATIDGTLVNPTGFNPQ